MHLGAAGGTHHVAPPGAEQPTDRGCKESELPGAGRGATAPRPAPSPAQGYTLSHHAPPRRQRCSRLLCHLSAQYGGLGCERTPRAWGPGGNRDTLRRGFLRFAFRRLQGLPLVARGQPGALAVAVVPRGRTGRSLPGGERAALGGSSGHLREPRGGRHLRHQPGRARERQHPLRRAASEGRGGRPLSSPHGIATQRGPDETRPSHQRSSSPRRDDGQPGPVRRPLASSRLPAGGRRGARQGERRRRDPRSGGLGPHRGGGGLAGRPDVRFGDPAHRGGAHRRRRGAGTPS